MEKINAETVYGFLMVVLILWAGISLGQYFGNHDYVCTQYKTIVSVDTFAESNIWGKDILFLVKYDDGTMYETSFAPQSSGQECNAYEWRKLITSKGL